MEVVSEHDADGTVAEISGSEFTGQANPATWQKLEPINDDPDPRYQHAMHYNAVTNQGFSEGVISNGLRVVLS